MTPTDKNYKMEYIKQSLSWVEQKQIWLYIDERRHADGKVYTAPEYINGSEAEEPRGKSLQQVKDVCERAHNLRAAFIASGLESEEEFRRLGVRNG